MVTSRADPAVGAESPKKSVTDEMHRISSVTKFEAESFYLESYPQNSAKPKKA
ncbi:MAG: hypothetical protein FWF12_09640 [Betaproteobacteria bacterium]|nr:hypothetical protein [Betaproteobacteria bacterium]